MESAALKESRRMLRRALDHLYAAHEALGAHRLSVGMVDIYHASTRTPELNYVTPRRNTAWVSGGHVQDGLEQLKTLGRPPRVMYIEGLILPEFERTLTTLGLEVERATPIRLRVIEAHSGASPRHFNGVYTPTPEQGADLWRGIIRNAQYRVITFAAEPLALVSEPSHSAQQRDFVMDLDGRAGCIARVSLCAQTQSGHLVAAALAKNAMPEHLAQFLSAVIDALAREDCTLLFAPAGSADDEVVFSQLGFADVQARLVVCATPSSALHDTHDDILVQPLLSFC